MRPPNIFPCFQKKVFTKDIELSGKNSAEILPPQLLNRFGKGPLLKNEVEAEAVYSDTGDINRLLVVHSPDIPGNL